MLDLQTKSAMKLVWGRVSVQATNHQLSTGFGGMKKHNIQGREDGCIFLKMLNLRSKYVIIIASFWNH